MGKLLFFAFAIIFSGCKEKDVPSIKIASDDSIEIQPCESFSELKENFWTSENGLVCVLIGYGFNDDDFVKNQFFHNTRSSTQLTAVAETLVQSHFPIPCRC